jgi:hypothetical protein
MALSMGVAVNAHATLLTIELDYEFSGGQEPQASNDPWLIATFVDSLDGNPLALGSNQVQLTLEANSLGSFQEQDGVDDQDQPVFNTVPESIDQWYFNFDDSKSVGNLGAAIQPVDPTTGGTTYTTGINSLKADGGGFFDFGFLFGGSDPFESGDVMTILLTYTGGDITVADFNDFSANWDNPTNTDDGMSQWGGDSNRHQSAAHIKNIADTGEGGFCDGSTPALTGPCGSGWLGGGGVPPSAIPVPAAVWLFGSGLLGLVGVARRRKSS